MDAELVQHVPVLRENWVLSVRGRVQTTLSDDDVVPFFLLPALGSGSTLRAYRSWRFRDRHSLLLQGEWRWIPNRYGLDMAIFVDAGKVTSRRADLDLDELRTNVGLGVRFHSPATTPLRVEIARGSEGWHLVFSGNAAF
jgi:outer membrane protein assembly factor BamA